MSLFIINLLFYIIMVNEQSKKENKENMKEKFPQIIVGIIAVIAIIFGLFYFNNQSQKENKQNGEQAKAEQENTNQEGTEQKQGEEGEVGGAQTQGQQGTPTPTPAPIKKDQKEYTVQEGDTLWSIAERRYGSGHNYTDIMSANNMANPDALEKGQKLALPDVEPKTATTGAAQNNEQGEQQQMQAQDKDKDKEQSQQQDKQQQADSQTTEYTVQPGDTLALISQKVYGTQENWQRIAEANNIMNPDQIAVGMKLMIPRK